MKLMRVLLFDEAHSLKSKHIKFYFRDSFKGEKIPLD